MRTAYLVAGIDPARGLVAVGIFSESQPTSPLLSAVILAIERRDYETARACVIHVIRETPVLLETVERFGSGDDFPELASPFAAQRTQP